MRLTVYTDCTLRVMMYLAVLKRGMRRAVDAFMRELDQMTLAETITAPRAAATLLDI